MIHVDRSRARVPAILQSDRVWRRVFQDAFHFSEPLDLRRQERHEHDRKIVYHVDVVVALHRLFRGRCAYCESLLEGYAVDQFRPPRGAVHSANRFSEDHYWWLAYEWENLNLACPSCHEAKGQKFPIDGIPAEIFADREQLLAEKRYLLDPCVDHPSQHLFYTPFAEIGGSTEAGKATVSVFDLNRADLRKARQEHLHSLMPVLELLKRQSGGWKLTREELADPRRTVAAFRKLREARDALAQAKALALRGKFSGMTFHFLRDAIYAGAGISKVALDQILGIGPASGPEEAPLATKATSKRQRRKLATPRIESVSLRNFRGIESLDLRCDHGAGPTAPWLMLLGENAAGKTSVLQAIALALMGEKRRRALRLPLSKLLRQGQESGSITVKLNGMDEPVSMIFSRKNGVWCSHKEPGVFLLGYGSARLVKGSSGPSKIPNAGLVRVRNLFDHFSPLINANRWLAKQRREAFDYTARALKDLLLLAKHERLERRRSGKRSGTRIRLFGSSVDLDDLSDGYQSVLALASDIIRGLNADQVGGLEAAEGIVLLDEIGAHLHPRWRVRMVTRLRRAFPRLQFISSTHDPLCLRGLEDGEVAVIRRSRANRVYSVEELPPVTGMSSEQLLTSEYFGLYSTVDPVIEEAFTRYYQLLSRRRPSAAEREELAELRTQLDSLKVLGKSQRERILLQIIDSFLAREPQDSEGTAERDLDGIIRKELRALLPANEGAAR